MRSVFAKALIGLFTALVIYKGYKYFYPDIPGYCYSQKRFISNAEFIEIALRETLLGGNHYFRPNIDSSDESIRNFYQQNPDCCQVIRILANTLPEGNSWQNIWHVDVVMHFKPLKKLNSSDPDIYETWTNINECGQVLDHFGGG